jgi:hypothetical protein
MKPTRWPPTVMAKKRARTERYRLGELLSRTGNFLLFLTATPHRGDPENFRCFLTCFNPDFFANADLLQESVRRSRQSALPSSLEGGP